MELNEELLKPEVVRDGEKMKRINQELTEEQEMAVSDFTLVLYDKLYSHGSALVKSGRAAEALEVFLKEVQEELDILYLLWSMRI